MEPDWTQEVRDLAEQLGVTFDDVQFEYMVGLFRKLDEERGNGTDGD